MFCTTFYSYKGGVGRTLALANIAVLLAKKGKRVLVVDFDLEAPGLTNMEPFSGAKGKSGVVDFICDYIDNDKVPVAADYIHVCSLVDPKAHGVSATLTLDVMPAGCGDSGYTARFSGIDWQSLYADRNGFLLMEDLRAQWAKAGYEYVLIDSRTGHTDIGGICTRQLPDATVIVFFPNEQNLFGLKEVVDGVRHAGGRPNKIELLFVASRVPKLDDEYDVLRNWLSRFKDELEYDDEQLLLVEHYDSLMLLNQAMFVLERPTSGLARQYNALCDRIIQLNMGDADGALGYTRAVTETLQDSRTRRRPDLDGDPTAAILEKLQSIGEDHQEDSVVQYALGVAFLYGNDPEQAAKAADRGIASLGKTKTTGESDAQLPAKLHFLRVRVSNLLDDFQPAVDSSFSILKEPYATVVMIADALITIANHDANELPEPASIPAIQKARPERLLAIAKRLIVAPHAAVTAAAIAELAVADDNWAWISSDEAYELVMIFIPGKKFDRAVKASGYVIADGFTGFANKFNGAIANWGLTGEPNIADFQEVIDKHKQFDQNSPNFMQCVALSYAAIGDASNAHVFASKAIEAIRRGAHRREFSCWTYQNVPQVEFEKHCSAITSYAEKNGPGPEVFS